MSRPNLPGPAARRPWAPVLALFLATACAPAYVDGLHLTMPDGSVVRVSRERGDGARFFLERPVAFGAGRDLAVSLRGSGSAAIRLFASARDQRPVASGEFFVAAGMGAECRIPLPEGASISVIELAVDDDGSAEPSGLSIEPSFWGFLLGDGGYVVDASTTLRVESDAVSARLELPRDDDASLIVGMAADGTARITPLDSSGKPGRALEASMRAGADLALPLAALAGASAVSIESPHGLRSASFAKGDGAPLADLHSILTADSSMARGFALYRWDILPGTLVFDFVDYDTQDRYLKRLAFFAEKPGFRGRLASDAEIEGLHGWNAHDYSTATLAAFFAKAEADAFPLNPAETELLALLEAFGVLRRDSGVVRAGDGALISIARESASGLRRTFLDHEASHALFFQDAGYRLLAERLWDGLGAEARRFWLTHLAWRRYDTRDRYLCYNEHQAYLVQQSTRAAPSYYESVIARLAEAYPERRERLEADAPFALESVRLCAETLDRYLAEHWGLAAGRFGRTRGL